MPQFALGEAKGESMTHPASIPAKRGRFAQANVEALITLGLYLGYFVWWYAFAYGLGSGNPDEYSYICGLPAWFFYSCIVGYPLLTLALWLVIRLFFHDMPLDAYRNAHPGKTINPDPLDGSVTDFPDTM